MEENEPKDSAPGSAEVWSYEQRRAGVKKLRMKAGLSQVRLGALAGVDPVTIARFENGKQDVKQSTLTKIEEALSDILAAQKRKAAGLEKTRPLSVMSPPAAGTEAYRKAREEFVSEHHGTISELVKENARLEQQVANYEKLVAALEGNLRNASRINDTLEELHTIESAALAELERSVPEKSEEASALLARARTLAEVVKK